MTTSRATAIASIVLALTASACGGGSSKDAPAPKPAATTSPTPVATASGPQPTETCAKAVQAGDVLLSKVTDVVELLAQLQELLIDGGKAGARNDLPGMKKAQNSANDIADEVDASVAPAQKATTRYEDLVKTCRAGEVIPACDDAIDETENLRTVYGGIYTELSKYLPLVTDLALAAADDDDAEIDRIEIEAKRIAAAVTKDTSEATRVLGQLSTARDGCGGSG